jgi:hypothetical protein
MGYPGWKGTIEYQLSHDLQGLFSSDLFRSTRVKGGGAVLRNRLRYEVSLFEADWPEIAKRRENYSTFQAVGGKKSYERYSMSEDGDN